MFIDTSILVDILRYEVESGEYGRIFEIIRDHPLYISILQIGEYSDWCYRSNLDPNMYLSKIKELVNVLSITEDICLDGSKIKAQQRSSGSTKFSLADGIITASARSINAPILTNDNDFRSIEEAIILDKYV
jgi:predicted nucleic acid-binding protein